MININFDRTNFYPLKLDTVSSKSINKFIKPNYLLNQSILDDFQIKEISSNEKIYNNSILFTNLEIQSDIEFNVLIITENQEIYNNSYRNIIYVSNLNLVYNDILNSLFFHEDDINFKDNFFHKDNYYVSNYAKIGKNVKIGINSVICRGVEIGNNCIIKNNVTIRNAIIGNNVNIGDNTSIGGTGFGFDLTKMGSSNIKPHIGIVNIEDNVLIGSNCTIDRARIHITHIGANSMLDNQIHLGHNVIIGENCCIAAQTGIAGSTIILDNVIIGGQVGIAGHIHIGKNVKIAAKSGVTKNIKSNSTIAGFPAIDIKSWKKNIIGNKYGHKRN